MSLTSESIDRYSCWYREMSVILTERNERRISVSEKRTNAQILRYAQDDGLSGTRTLPQWRNRTKCGEVRLYCAERGWTDSGC